MRHRIEAFLVSRRNLAGSALGLGGLALFATGITGGVLGLSIAAGLYLAGVLLTPRVRSVDLALAGTQDVSAVREALDRLLQEVRWRIADDLYAKVSGIRDSIVSTLPVDGPLQGISERDVYLIRQTALDYLPSALNAYLALPRRYAEHRTVSGGRTAHDLLLEQLDLMDRKMAEVADDIAHQDTDRLLAHGRFLAEKFSGSTLSVDADAGGVAAAAFSTSAAPPPPAPSADARIEEEQTVERERVR